MRMTSFTACLVGLLLLSSSAAEARDWTKFGGTRFEAEFVRLEQCAGKRAGQVMIVVFRKTDGVSCTVRLTTLSASDQTYVINLLPPPPEAVLPQPPKPDVSPLPKPSVQPAPVVGPVRLYYRPKITPITIDLRKIVEETEEAKRRFRGLLDEFPTDVLTAQVVGIPTPININGPKVTLRVQVRLGADETHMGRFLKQILLAMEDFQEYHWEERWLFAPAGNRNLEYVRTGMQGERKAVTEDTTVYVNTENNAAWTALKWKAFALNQMLADVFGDAAKRRCECVVSIVTKAGDTVPVDRFPLDAEHIGGAALITERSGPADEGKTFFISPMFLHDAGCSKHAPTATVSRRITIRGPMLNRLEGFTCKVQFVAGDKGGG